MHSDWDREVEKWHSAEKSNVALVHLADCDADGASEHFPVDQGSCTEWAFRSLQHLSPKCVVHQGCLCQGLRRCVNSCKFQLCCWFAKLVDMQAGGWFSSPMCLSGANFEACSLIVSGCNDHTSHWKLIMEQRSLSWQAQSQEPVVGGYIIVVHRNLDRYWLKRAETLRQKQLCFFPLQNCNGVYLSFSSPMSN